MLAKFGVPPLVISLVRSLYDGSTISSTVDGIKPDPFANSTGVKQGDNLAPALFLYVFQAAFESIVWPAECQPLQFQSRFDSIIRNRDTRKSTAGVTNFEVRESLYADDCCALFATAEQLRIGTEALRNHLACFGMEMHYAHPGEELKASKTVALHVLPRGASVSVFSLCLLPNTTTRATSKRDRRRRRIEV